MAAGEAFTTEFLINQVTHTCLAVLRGTGVHDAILGMARCSGGIKQQWFFNDGQWLWGGDRTLCLSKNDESGGLCLASVDSVSESWIHDQEDRLILGSQALAVAWERPSTQVTLLAKNKQQIQKWWTFSQLKASLENDLLVGEHSLSPTALKMCKRELDRATSMRRPKTLRRKKENQCEVSDGFLLVSSCEGEVLFDEKGVTTPEYLVSQSTLTCLTVLDVDDPDGASIGLSPFTGSVDQQWFVNGNEWHWGGDRSYCLSAKPMKGIVKLFQVSKRNTSWSFDDTGLMKVKSKVLQAPLEEKKTHVTLARKNGDAGQRWWKLSEVRSTLQGTAASENDYPEELVRMVEEMPSQDTEGEGHCLEQGMVDTSFYEEQGVFSEEPEYLISQSIHDCLAVLDDSSPEDATIGVAPYTGDSKQQWFVKEGMWQWAHDDSYYLVPDLDNGTLRLASDNDMDTLWTFSEDGLFMNGSHALEVPSEEEQTRVILTPKHGGKTQKWWLLSNLKPFVGKRLYPFPTNDAKTYSQEITRGIVNRLSPLSEALPHPRDVGHYPGTVAATTPRINLSCTLNVGTIQQPENIRMRAPSDWQATNMYVVAGDVFSVILPDTLTEEQVTQITIRVGAQSDRLKPSLPKLKNKTFRRMPFITEDFDLNPGVNHLRSQFGGNLIFKFDGRESFSVTAELQNVVESPYYVLGQSNEEDWDNMKGLDTPFSALESYKVVLIVPTSRAKKISNPDYLLYRYDDIVEKLQDLAGFTEDDPPPQGKVWLVDDVQISFGSAHAGFPIMFQHQFNDLTSLDTPYSWVVWHEIGHNYQQRQFWSYAYGSEATVNLFSLYVQEKLKANDRLQKTNRYVTVAKAVDNGLTFQQANCWQKLVFLMEIKHAFPDHGWDMYRHLNRVTRALSQEEAKTVTSKRQKQYDFAYTTLSRFVEADLILHYERWGLTVSKKAKEEVESLGLPKAPRNLSVFCPSDDGHCPST